MKTTIALLCFLFTFSISATPLATVGYCESFAAGYVQAAVDFSGGTLSQGSQDLIYSIQLEICQKEQEQ